MRPILTFLDLFHGITAEEQRCCRQYSNNLGFYWLSSSDRQKFCDLITSATDFKNPATWKSVFIHVKLCYRFLFSLIGDCMAWFVVMFYWCSYICTTSVESTKDAGNYWHLMFVYCIFSALFRFVLVKSEAWPQICWFLGLFLYFFSCILLKYNGIKACIRRLKRESEWLNVWHFLGCNGACVW